MTEEDYIKAEQAWCRFVEYSEKCEKEGIDPFTGEKLNK